MRRRAGRRTPDIAQSRACRCRAPRDRCPLPAGRAADDRVGDEGIVRLRASFAPRRASSSPSRMRRQAFAHVSLATRTSVPRRGNPTAPNRPLRQRSIGQSGPFARSIERGYLRAHACCLAVLARGELAAAKFALARDGVAGPPNGVRTSAPAFTPAALARVTCHALSKLAPSISRRTLSRQPLGFSLSHRFKLDLLAGR